MIRFATGEDISQIINMWNISFNEDETFTKWFFKNIFSSENTLVFEKNGVLCSMLQRLPFELKNTGKVTYIYGACTLPDFRGEGIMAKLLEYSEKYDKMNGIEASVLIPQGKSLFDFYAKFGYKPEFKINSKEYKKQNERDHSLVFAKCEYEDIQQINDLYMSVLEQTNYIVRSTEYWEKQLELYNFFGNVFCIKNNNKIAGYAFVWESEKIIVQELIAFNRDIKKILCNKIMDFYKIEKIKVFSLNESSRSEDFGCIKFYNKTKNELPYIMNLLYN